VHGRASGLAQDCVAELSECAAQIGSVTDVIGAIAAQTNLLSLNATIEAARAGASGRSFAIVAGEVKELAGRTAQATIEVRDMVEKIQDAARRSVDALALVSSRIQEQRELCERIEAAVIAQSSSTSQIRQEAGSVANAASATLAAIKAIQATVASAQAACEETKDLAGGMSADSEVLSTEFREFASQLQTR
jgi:methyl-accepting chemotaxis protein